MNRPFGVCVNAKNEILFADVGNNRIRKLSDEEPPQSDNIIKTIAGLFEPTGLALDIAIRKASGIDVDLEGNIFFSDSGNHRILKIDKNGNVETVAGNGTAGFSGDFDDATKAQLKSPHGILYADGSLYIADKGNHSIRIVNQDGIITTLVGNGFPGKCDCPSLMTNCLDEPTDVAMNQWGDLYISDSNNHRIIKINEKWNDMYLVAGNGTICEKNESCGDGDDAVYAQLNTPTGIEFNRDGHLLIADSGAHRVRIVYEDTKKINTYIGSGLNEPYNSSVYSWNVNLSYPTDIVEDTNGFLYIADSGHNRIRIVGKNDGVLGSVITIAGDGNDTCTDLNQNQCVYPKSESLVSPISLALNSNGSQLFITDKCHRLIRIDSDPAKSEFTNLIKFAGSEEHNFSGDDGPAISASLDFPHNIATDKWGNLYIADTKNHRIRKISSENGEITTIAGTGIAGYNNDGVHMEYAQLNLPHDVAINSDGDIFIADTKNHRIRVIDYTTNIIDTIAGDGHQGCYTDDDNDGRLATFISLNFPQGIAVDNAGNLYIADTGNRKIRKMDMNTRTITNIADYENLSKPCDLVVDSQRNVYVSDTLKHQVFIISQSLSIKPYAGDGSTDYTYGEENRSAVSASLYSPTYIDIDDEFNLYIADTGHHTIRKVLATSKNIITIAGNYHSGFSGESKIPFMHL
ncbi:MAG: NHL repeat-containing protein [Candidatus Magnetoglobus multicellularis str. Araruama]|uniref:NHL repeat-containing protein n=1 Tax=Candidatus Magnetoglobus multicellularis str. Araruama TaxID=890399 RepID=A0A1V1P305_9BACT|nr:MAG: NHL repeat-containing protein [Candidatus Magnetoglobus multicellularis str. Araruama]